MKRKIVDSKWKDAFISLTKIDWGIRRGEFIIKS